MPCYEPNDLSTKLASNAFKVDLALIIYSPILIIYLLSVSDERKDYCYHSDGDNGEDTKGNGTIPGPIIDNCSERFPMKFSTAQCCCNSGTHYGSKICTACPARQTGKFTFCSLPILSHSVSCCILDVSFSMFSV